MIITFYNKKLENECNDYKLAVRIHGTRRAKILRRRLDDLKAVECLEDMSNLPGHCHELRGNLSGLVALDLDHPMRLILKPVDDPPSLLPDGGIDRRNVKSIMILRIEDYHE